MDEQAIAVSAEEAARSRRLSLSTAFVSVATAFSRIAGLVREVISAKYFGTKGDINVFTAAFQIPNLIRTLVADAALSSAFVPVFSEMLVKGQRARAWRVASTLFWLMLLGLGALTALFMLAAPLVMAIFGYDGHQEQLAIVLSRILFPIVALFRMVAKAHTDDRPDKFGFAALALLWAFSIAPASALAAPPPWADIFKTAKTMTWLAALALLLVRTRRARAA